MTSREDIPEPARELQLGAQAINEARRERASQFPAPPLSGTPSHDDRRARWELGRKWAGYPELEWTFPLFPERVTALGGRMKAFFYEPLGRFDHARFAIRLNAVMLAQRELSFPSVTVGFEFFDGAYRVPDGRLRIPAEDEPYRGRHYVMTLDNDEMEILAFVNTWGERWGDSGRGYIDRAYFDSHVDDVIVRWSAAGGLSPAMADCLSRPETRRLPQREQFAHCWPTRNYYWDQAFDFRGQRHQLLMWQVLSIATGGLVDVFEIRGPVRIVGRAHVFHVDGKSIVKELFVLPSLRRRGYGSLLEQVSADCARNVGSKTLEIWLHEGDARPRVRPAAEGLTRSAGYEWQPAQMRRPNVVAVATKGLQ